MAATEITALDGSQGWTLGNVGGGQSELVDLTGAGGDLETNQPAPGGAVKQTTTLDNGDKSNVKYSADFGRVGAIFDQDLSFAYSYYKSSGSPNASAAPALKLEFYLDDAQYDGDKYGELIYEPYWQGSNPATDAWTEELITFSSGLFWTTGMFGIPNSFGGPPLNTLEGWLSTFDQYFRNATLISVGIGIGSYNQGQVNYFDNVVIAGTEGPNGTYDFEAAAEVPLPAALPLMLGALGAVGGVGALRRRKRG